MPIGQAMPKCITDTLYQAIIKKDLESIRIALKNSMMVDPTFKEFDEIDSFIKNRGINIYVRHDGQELNKDQSLWNVQYMNDQMVRVIDNFSKERIAHLKEVCSIVYKDRIKEILTKRSNNDKTSEKTYMNWIHEFITRFPKYTEVVYNVLKNVKNASILGTILIAKGFTDAGRNFMKFIREKFKKEQVNI